MPTTSAARKAALEAETQARIDELTKKFEEQRGALEAKIVADKEALEARVAEVTAEGTKVLEEAKAEAHSRVADLTAKLANLEDRWVESMRVC